MDLRKPNPAPFIAPQTPAKKSTMGHVAAMILAASMGLSPMAIMRKAMGRFKTRESVAERHARQRTERGLDRPANPASMPEAAPCGLRAAMYFSKRAQRRNRHRLRAA